MTPAIASVLQALAGQDVAALTAAVQGCQEIDERLPDGESVLFHAVLSGQIRYVEILLASGADPNFRATEPAKDILAPTPLDLAQQARLLLSWDRYQPIARRLQASGARDCEGHVECSPEQRKAIETRARAWQSGRGGWKEGWKLRVRLPQFHLSELILAVLFIGLYVAFALQAWDGWFFHGLWPSRPLFCFPPISCSSS